MDLALRRLSTLRSSVFAMSVIAILIIVFSPGDAYFLPPIYVRLKIIKSDVKNAEYFSSTPWPSAGPEFSNFFSDHQEIIEFSSQLE
jgi:hypothetical protein